MTKKNKNEVQEVSNNNTSQYNVYQKLHYAIENAGAVVKQNAGRYKAGSYNDVIRVVKKACIKARIVPVTDLKWQKHDNGVECLVGLRVIDIDNHAKSETGDQIYHNIFLGTGHAFSAYKKDKDGNFIGDDLAKVSGSVFSYAHKYILQKAFCLDIEASQDLDFNASSTTGESLEDALGLK